MITAKWTGLDEAIRAASALGHELASEEVLRPALLKTGAPLKEDIVRTTPRSPYAPHVADTFVMKVSAEERGEGRTTVLIGPSAASGSVGFVAPFLEFGTSKMGARPWIRPAYDAFNGGFAGALAAQMRVQYDKVVRKYVTRVRGSK